MMPACCYGNQQSRLAEGSLIVFKIFNFKYRTCLGVDITPSFIHIIELSLDKQRVWLTKYASSPLPSQCLQGKEVIYNQALSQCIRQLVVKQAFKTRNAAIALPDRLVMSAILPVSQRLTAKDKQQFVKMEAEQFFSLPLSALCCDYTELKQSTIQPGMIELFMVAAPRDLILQRQIIFEQAGLKLQAVDVESLAQLRLLTQHAMYQFDTYGLIEIRPDSLYFLVIHASYRIFFHEQPLPASKNPEQFYRLLCEQIQQGCQLFNTAYPLHKIEQLLCTGELVTHELVAFMRDQLRISLALFNPLHYLQWLDGQEESTIQPHATCLTVACGLALRNYK